MFINAQKSWAPGTLACLREGAQDAAPAREEIARLAAALA
jgi:hypothetical protein